MNLLSQSLTKLTSSVKQLLVHFVLNEYNKINLGEKINNLRPYQWQLTATVNNASAPGNFNNFRTVPSVTFLY